jgi:hypothetical protein
VWAFLFLAGCAASVSRVATKPATTALERGSRVLVVVTGNPAVSLTKEEGEFFGNAIVSRLSSTGAFAGVYLRNGSQAGDRPDYVLKCEATRVHRVGRGMRVASGLLAGGSDPAMVEASVTILPGSGQPVMIAGAVISGKSSEGGTLFMLYGMFSGTTEQAFEKTAEGIASFVSEQVR